MALIKCSECGRTISDKASACVGCGAPLAGRAAFTHAAPRPEGPAPTRNQIMRRAVVWAATFVLGVAWSSALKHPSGNGQVAAVAAALLVVVGLCGVIVTAVQFYGSRK